MLTFLTCISQALYRVGAELCVIEVPQCLLGVVPVAELNGPFRPVDVRADHTGCRRHAQGMG